MISLLKVKNLFNVDQFKILLNFEQYFRLEGATISDNNTA
jgi:hypothetical protein